MVHCAPLLLSVLKIALRAVILMPTFNDRAPAPDTSTLIWVLVESGFSSMSRQNRTTGTVVILINMDTEAIN